MRATLSDALRHPSWLGDWWLEFPPRRRRFWNALLFERGQGWLRWSVEERTGYDWEPDALAHAPYPYTVAPPLRRLWFYLRAWPVAVKIVTVGYRFEGAWHRDLCWEEVAPIWPSELCDPERKRDVWGDRVWNQRTRKWWRR